MGRILAIGDIHGCRRSLELVLSYVGVRTDDVIVCVGDYVDRGPDSRGVVEFLIRLKLAVPVVTLMGNHEKMMLEARDDSESVTQWVNVGGAATLQSYEGVTFENVPQSHWEFIESLLPYYETENHIFVHANLDPELELEDQPGSMLYWDRVKKPSRFKKLPPHISGKKMICGHTPQKSGKPLVLDHGVCIDTLAYGGGWLTCMDVETGEYWQAKESGEVNKGIIEIEETE